MRGEYWCPRCEKFRMPGSAHKCPPIWHVQIIDYEEDDREPRAVYADTPTEAAEKRCDAFDSGCGDYPLVGSGDARALVWDAAMENPLLVDVEIRMEPVYAASRSRIDAEGFIVERERKNTEGAWAEWGRIVKEAAEEGRNDLVAMYQPPAGAAWRDIDERRRIMRKALVEYYEAKRRTESLP